MQHSILTIVALFSSIALSSLGAVEPQRPSGETVLLLRNGEVLSGMATKVGDRYVITLGNGSELRIPVRDVEMHCLNRKEAFLRKRDSMDPNSIPEYLTLADWCLRNDLHSEAAGEVLNAIAVDAKDPRIKWFERRLEMAVDRPDSTVRRVDPEPRPVNLDELERTMQELPDQAVETFVSRVQPLLLNRCAANTCHGVRSTADFRLVRPGWGKTITRRFTQRNLHATLKGVDFDAPEKSQLLVAPSAVHGGGVEAVFSERDELQLRLLVDWVIQVTRSRRKTQSLATVAESQLMQASYNRPVHLPAAGGESSSEPRLGPGAGSGRSAGKAAPGAALRSAARDPFDPAVFNRRYIDSESAGQE